MASLISAAAWVPRGAAMAHPRKYVVDAAEMERVGALARVRLEDARMELEMAQLEELEIGQGGEAGEAYEAGEQDWEDEAGKESGEEDEEMDLEGDATKAAEAMAKTIKQPVGPDDLSAYNLDDYDEESQSTAMGAFSNIKGLSYYGDNADDPYVSLESKQEDEDLEREELEIYPTDSLIVVAKTEDDVSQLEIYVYDESEENLYVHHDLLLPAMPLCLEWLDFCPGRSNGAEGHRGNYVAVGTLDPEIEIWSLDVVDGLYPDAILGPPPKNGEEEIAPVSSIRDSTPAESGEGKKKKKKKPKKAKVVINADYHVDSILSLSWNRSHRNLLASSSADKTIKLWDLSLPTSSPALRSFDSLHTDKIQSVQWNPKEPTVLLSGSWDGSVRVFDSRAPDAGVGTKVASDVECLKWDPWEPAGFLVSMENGLVQSYDSRMLSSAKVPTPGKALWTLSAHDASVSSLDINTKIKGCIVTGGTDNLVKVWNIEEQDGGKRHISLVASRDLGVGKVFSACFCPDDATTLAVAGSKANLQIWDTISNAGVRQVFGDRLRALGKDMSAEYQGNGVVGLANDDEGDSAAED